LESQHLDIRVPYRYVKFDSFIYNALYSDFAGSRDTDRCIKLFLAEHDFPVCDGDCNGIYDLAQLKQYNFPNASAVDVYVQPKTGHGLALHKNATAGYKVMFDFLDTNGL
jgi:hypothetical protein